VSEERRGDAKSGMYQEQPPDIYYCTDGSRCKWKCFALHKGVGIGKADDPSSQRWRQWHSQECPGALVQLWPSAQLAAYRALLVEAHGLFVQGVDADGCAVVGLVERIEAAVGKEADDAH